MPPNRRAKAVPLVLRPFAPGILLILSFAATPSFSGQPALTFSDCQLEHPQRRTVVPAECSELTVPENPGEPGGRQISLRIVRINAISRRSEPDPLFIIAGGPGASATEFYATFATAFGRIGRQRDIVLVDQRGTGGSNRLDCAENEDALSGAAATVIAARTRACLDSLESRANVAYYTTSLAVQDLERVRAALGYQRINLYGNAYGTRVAQQYLRRFPQHTRTVILDGVLPVGVAAGPEASLDAEHVLLDVIARCARDRACRDAFGDPLGDYHAVRATLASGAVQVSVIDPTSGETKHFDFTSATLATVLRMTLYTSDYVALLPLRLHAAAAHEDYAPLAAQLLLLEHTHGDSVAVGAHNSVMCAEDVPFADTSALDRAALASTFLGTSRLEVRRVVCGLWPRGPVDADLHAPLTSTVPALLLSGSDDPISPPEYARRAAKSFPQSVTIEFPAFGHNELTAVCIDRVMATFVARASVAGLDVSCTHSARVTALFTSVNGPPP
jgi:pimeloyl-ACP methyl ester carboxylesterase